MIIQYNVIDNYYDDVIKPQLKSNNYGIAITGELISCIACIWLRKLFNSNYNIQVKIFYDDVILSIFYDY